jgi:hypothetical protein
MCTWSHNIAHVSTQAARRLLTSGLRDQMENCSGEMTGRSADSTEAVAKYLRSPSRVTMLPIAPMIIDWSSDRCHREIFPERVPTAS